MDDIFVNVLKRTNTSSYKHVLRIRWTLCKVQGKGRAQFTVSSLCCTYLKGLPACVSYLSLDC